MAGFDFVIEPLLRAPLLQQADTQAKQKGINNVDSTGDKIQISAAMGMARQGEDRHVGQSGAGSVQV
jgi:hypothetical protein